MSSVISITVKMAEKYTRVQTEGTKAALLPVTDYNTLNVEHTGGRQEVR